MEFTFTERVDTRAVNYLLLQMSQTFLDTHSANDDSFTLSHVKNILHKYKDGKQDITYKKSKFDTKNMYRFYGSGIQGVPTTFRGLLCNGIMTDIDMVNCYPTILMNLCKQKNIPCHYLTEYCEKRKELLALNTFTKIDILKCINKKTKAKGDPWLVAFDTEMKLIQTHLIPHFQEIYNSTIEDKSKNHIGTFMTRVCMFYENKFLLSLIDYIHPKYPVAVLMFDGLMVYGNPPDELLEELSDFITAFHGFNIKFTYKSHDTSIVIPDDFADSEEATYELLKEKYEKDYQLAFINKTVSYSYKIKDIVCFFNREQLKQILSPIVVGKSKFFNKWVDDTERQTYEDVGVFPHDVPAPTDVMNLWNGFAVEKIIYPLVDIQPILNHLHILVNHEETSYLFMLKWLANMFQFPSSTSIFVSLSSEEGAGKSLFIEMIAKMVGADKSAEITNLNDQLFGVFNSQLRDVVFMNINEVERKDGSKCFERLKSQITSPTIDVHGKGEKPYTIANLRKFISTNNNPHAIIIKKGNRRYFATESSNELIGNIDYFTSFIELINKPETRYSFWKFLMDYECPRNLTVKDIPVTLLMTEAILLNRDPIEDFAEELPINIRIFNDENYTSYRQFMTRSGLEFALNKKSFEMKFMRIIKDRIVNKGRTDLIIDDERVTRSFFELR